ncbi:MAG: DUF3494 domain-containing protein [Proteobacteria bacterium]|nr:DUF3494 domain-containing protein [Pseudomonadota bacterium]
MNNKRTAYSKMWFLALLLITFVAGCASNAQEIPVIPDTVAPTVSFTAPANGQTAVPYDRKVSVAFSEAMDVSTITTTTFTVTGPGLTPVPGTVSGTGSTATFTPTATFSNNTLYTATITIGAKDLAGNALAANYVWSFTTGAAADTTPPTVSFTAPINNQTAVPTNRILHAAFSEAMDPLTITATNFTVTGPGATPVSGTVAPFGTSATFTPTSALANNTLYTATIKTGVKDLAGNAMASNYVFTFTTGAVADTTPPTVNVTSPTNTAIAVPINRKVTVGFSEAMNPLTITTASFTLTGPGVTPVTGIVTPVGTSAIFTPVTNLANDTLYTATIKNSVKDLAGNAMASNFVFTFTTGALADTAAPVVTQVTPADLATNVAVTSVVTATFSKDMDPLTISTATVSVANVTGVVTYDAATRTATFKPAANLAVNTKYTATVTTGAKDSTSNALVNNKVWSFTTAGAIVPPVSSSHLGSAATFGIMATSAITNTGAATMVNGDVSLDPGTSNGLLPVQVNGTIHINDTVSAQARADLLIAYNYYKNLPPGVTISGGADLGALYPLGIPPGTYTSGSTMLVSTPLVLDAGGNANAVWVFQIGSSLTTGSSVSLKNGAQAKNVFWVPTLDATVGVGTIFYGTIVSGRDVTAVTGATINGRILAGATLAGTIALQTTTINVPAQ